MLWAAICLFVSLVSPSWLYLRNLLEVPSTTVQTIQPGMFYACISTSYRGVYGDDDDINLDDDWGGGRGESCRRLGDICQVPANASATPFAAAYYGYLKDTACTRLWKGAEGCSVLAALLAFAALLVLSRHRRKRGDDGAGGGGGADAGAAPCAAAGALSFLAAVFGLAAMSLVLHAQHTAPERYAWSTGWALWMCVAGWLSALFGAAGAMRPQPAPMLLQQPLLLVQPQPQPVVYVQQQAPPPGQGQRGLPVAYAQPSLAPLPGQPQGQAQVPAAGGYNPTFVAQQQAAYEQAQQRAALQRSVAQQ